MAKQKVKKTVKASRAAKKTEYAKILEAVVQGLLSQIGIDGDVKSSGVEEGVAHVSVSTPTPALLIGYHGKTLDALSAASSAIAYKKLEEQIRVIVDVDEWRQKREEKLLALAQNIATRVASTGQEEPIYNLTPAERRAVHVALEEIESVTTESRGEGRDRHLVVKPADK